MKGRESQIWFNSGLTYENSCRCVQSSFAHWDDGYKRTVIGFFTEFHDSVRQCEQCVVFAHAYIFTGVMLRATLTHDDISRDATLATKNFDAEPFRFRLASVFRTSYTFFMCHYSSVFFVLAAAGFFAAGFFAAGALAAGFSVVAFFAPPALMPVILISVNEARKPFNFW